MITLLRFFIWGIEIQIRRCLSEKALKERILKALCCMAPKSFPNMIMNEKDFVEHGIRINLSEVGAQLRLMEENIDIEDGVISDILVKLYLHGTFFKGGPTGFLAIRAEFIPDCFYHFYLQGCEKIV